jgi:sulfonate transport system substrate-binding protein
VRTRFRHQVLPVLVLLAAVAACAPASGGTDSASHAGSGDVTLHVGDQKGGSRALLSAAGQLKGLKYKVAWSEFTSGPPLLEAVNAAAIDIGGVGDTPPLFAAAAHSRITIVAADRSVPNGSAILVPADSSIHAVAQLKGHKVALAKGSSSNYHLLAALRQAGLSYKDITPVYLQPSDALSAFSQHQVDAWAIWDPYTAIGQAQTHARVLVTGRGLASGLSFQVASPNALRDSKKVAALRDYLHRLATARDWANRHQAAWAKAWSVSAGIPVDVARVATNRSNPHAIRIDDGVVRDEQGVADAFAAAGLLPGDPVHVASLVDRRFNDVR